MKITHVAVYVKNIEAMKSYYVNYFGAASNEKYTEPDGFSSYFLSFPESEIRLELMSHTLLADGEKIDRISGYSHIAISVGSREEVIRLTNQLEQDGFQIYLPARETGDGYFESCMADPEGNRVEITE